ncbi:TrmB family transcriptional regulator [Halobacteriaceae bacterium SHR40]|uniref:TrmB family transcriptional regulator n=1 Tax=Halovenus amylolytica TaxID=2500550 RepID=UPI000FE3522E
MNRNELITILEDAGLSPYQADAYVTILKMGAAPATEIVKASDVPDPRIYDVLRDLENLGYVELYEQDSLHARPHSVDEVLDDLESRASRFSEAAQEIEHRWEEPAMQDSTVSIVKRFETVLNKADTFIRSAQNQVLLSVDIESYERLRPALQVAKENGANVHISLSTNRGDHKRDLPSPEELVDVSTAVRFRKLPSPFMAIVDRTKACFVPHPDSANLYGILVNDRTHTYIFHWFFLTTQWDIWESHYDESTDTIVGDYIDIRYCIQAIRPVLDRGDTVRVRISGFDTNSGSVRTIEGTVSEILVVGSEHPPTDHIATYGGQIGMVVETETGPVEVGGWGAMIEDIEAHTVSVLSVEK